MIVSSCTPEGSPNHCPICGKDVVLEPSQTGDGTCPSCGHLLWWFNTRLADQLGVVASQINASTSFVNDLGTDSLDVVELVVELEEEFDINISDDAAKRIQTVGDAIRHIQEAQSGGMAT